MQILYKDPYLLLVQKDAGMPSQPDPSGREDLLTLLQKEYPYVGLVHRLDAPTGGVMVYALREDVTAKLSALVQDHAAFVKQYLAVTACAPDEKSGEISDLLYHDKKKNKAYVVEKKRGGSKEARLWYQTLSVADNGYALHRIRLYTGRTHQIRVQFASRKMPLVGDGKYGSREKAPYIALWSHKLSFPHPITKKLVEVSCFPPKGLQPWNAFDLTSEGENV